jgi:hypothetical protein
MLISAFKQDYLLFKMITISFKAGIDVEILVSAVFLMLILLGKEKPMKNSDF